MSVFGGFCDTINVKAPQAAWSACLAVDVVVSCSRNWGGRAARAGAPGRSVVAAHRHCPVGMQRANEALLGVAPEPQQPAAAKPKEPEKAAKAKG